MSFSSVMYIAVSNKLTRNYFVLLDYGVANTDSETIERGPSFIEEPSDVIYDEASVTKYTQINCEADAYPPPSYEWYKWRSNVEEVIDSTTDTRYTMVNGKLIIHIPSVENKDDAEYHCRPYNKFGKIRSQSANLGFGCMFISYFIKHKFASI